MSRVVIVARTRMHGDYICIGGHDLDRSFRGLRLFDRWGNHWRLDSPFAIGDVWDVQYWPARDIHPPHVEDVRVKKNRRLATVADLRAMVLKHEQPWTGPPDALFDGLVRGTQAGTGYIPSQGQLPPRSTGFWLPDASLSKRTFDAKTRFLSEGRGSIKRFSWVGVQEPPERIEAGSLVRVSLSRLFGSSTAPEGYYVQISGVL